MFVVEVLVATGVVLGRMVARDVDTVVVSALEVGAVAVDVGSVKVHVPDTVVGSIAVCVDVGCVRVERLIVEEGKLQDG